MVIAMDSCKRKDESLCYLRNKFTFYRQNKDLWGYFSRPSQLQKAAYGLRLAFIDNGSNLDKGLGNAFL